MGRAFHRRRRVSRNNLADHQVIKEHFDSRQVLLDRFAVNPGASRASYISGSLSFSIIARRASRLGPPRMSRK